MIRERPTLPIGFSLAGSPPIERVLHTDLEWEIYKLESSVEQVEQGALLLFLGRIDRDVFGRVSDWWLREGSRNLTVQRIFEFIDLPGFTAAALLIVHRNFLSGKPLVDAKLSVLKSLLFGIIDLVAATDSLGTTPNLDPRFVWLSEDGEILVLMPSVEDRGDEAETVEYVARSFYRLATGIDLNTEGRQPAALSQWCKNAGPELSQIIESCLVGEWAKGRINSLAKLNSRLGRTINSAMQEVPAEPVPQRSKHGLERVAGMHQLKELLRGEVVEPVRNPEPFRQYGLSIPNGILLYGPPGCGKTYIARALAEELGHYFVEIVPSEFASPFVHGGVIRIRELFDDAAEHAPAVVFIDEFEALVPHRTALGGFQQHKAEEVNELLTHLNGSSEKGIFVVAATNQPEMIDPAVRRTGRLDKLIYVGVPDVEARREMLALHLSGRPLAPDLGLHALAVALSGYSASDIRLLVDEAAREALARRGNISAESFRIAMLKVKPSVPQEIEAQYRTIEQRGL